MSFHHISYKTFAIPSTFSDVTFSAFGVTSLFYAGFSALVNGDYGRVQQQLDLLGGLVFNFVVSRADNDAEGHHEDVQELRREVPESRVLDVMMSVANLSLDPNVEALLESAGLVFPVGSNLTYQILKHGILVANLGLGGEDAFQDMAQVYAATQAIQFGAERLGLSDTRAGYYAELLPGAVSLVSELAY